MENTKPEAKVEAPKKSEPKIFYFKQNVTAHMPSKEHGLIRTHFKKGDVCPGEIAKEMFDAGLISSKEQLQAEAGPINQVKKSKLPDMASRG